MIDCHIHFDEEIVSADGLLASMDANGISKAALIAPICPDIEETAFIRLGGPVLRGALNHSLRSLRRIVRRMYDRWAVDGGNVVVGGKHYPLFVQPDNDSIMSAVTDHPERFCGWIFINPAGPVDPVSELERCLETPGMIGAKAHPYWHRYPTSALEDVAALCQERGLPMLIHLGTEKSGDYTLLPRKFPNLHIIYAHAGVPYQRAVCELAGSTQNVFVDLSSATYVTPGIARRALSSAGPEKVLFGSDGPYFHHNSDRFDYGIGAAMLDSLELSEIDRERIASGNFEALIGKE